MSQFEYHGRFRFSFALFAVGKAPRFFRRCRFSGKFRTCVSPARENQFNDNRRCIDESEKSAYGDAIRNYFSLKLAETERDIKRKGFVSLIFAIIGVVALIFMIIYESFVNNAVWTECIDIFAWVFLWEAVDQFFIERSGLLLKRKRFENFVNMSIEFK